MFKPLINETAPGPKSIIEACIRNINCWMNANKLKRNNSKTELLVIQAPQRPLSSLRGISSGTKLIQSTRSAKHIGVWFDDIMAMSKQMNAICKKAFYHLRNIASIKKFNSYKHCEQEIFHTKYSKSCLKCC